MNISPARVLALAAALVAAAPASGAETYPTRPIRYVVGFVPGGATDILARAMQPRLSEKFGQQVVVDNRPGANGNVAAEIVARSPADGHTILLATIGVLSINPSLYRKLAFDALKDFAPVAQLVSLSNVVVANPSLQATGIRDLIALARARPGQITYATSGSGGTGHLAGELFKTMAGVDIIHVPYKGGAPALVDVVSGQVNTFFATVPTALPQIKAGRIRALAVTTARRSVALPDVPTIEESAGLKGYEANNWYGLVVAAGTPAAIVRRIETDALTVLKLQEVQEKLLAQGLEPTPAGPGAFGAYIKSEHAKWAKVIKAAGAKVD
jgi:tripartite-type tricarboxylate transporter receptor subunit TctC